MTSRPIQVWPHFLQNLAQQDCIDAIFIVRLDPRLGKPHYAKLADHIDSDGCILPSTLRPTSNAFRKSESFQRMASFANVRNGDRISGVMSIYPLNIEDKNQLNVRPNHRLTGANA